jgi:hypothetical protein
MAERPRIDPMKGANQVALNDLAHELAEVYQRTLEQDGINATGELSKSAIQYVFNWKGDVLVLTFRLPEYWYYIEHGRNATSGVTGQQWADPVGDILRWIEAKRLVPNTPMKSARVPRTRKQLTDREKKERMAQAIVHKIHREGFYSPNHHGKHPLERSIVETRIRERIVGILADAYGQEIRVELADAVQSFKKRN